MRRALRPLLSALCLAGCRPASPAQVPEPHSACDAQGPQAAEPELGPPSEPEWGARVSSVELHGLVRVPAQLARSVVTTHVGDALSEPTVSADLRALLALEVFEDAAVETEATPGGVRLRYLLRERKQIARVELRGLTEPGPGRWAPLATGELYDPARVRRAAVGLEDHLSESGYLEARVEVRQRVGRDRVDVCLWVERGQRWLVSELTPHGNERVSRREIVALIDDHDGRANRPGAPFRADLFEADRVRIAAYYYDRGFLDARVGEPELDRLRGRLLIPIHEGAPYRISSVTFAGKLRGGDQKYRELLGVAPDQLFSRSAVQTGLERVASHHRALGRTARATPETTLDARNHRVSLRIVIEEDAP